MNFHLSSRQRRCATPVIACLTLAVGACASPGMPPVAEMTAARASISQAESAGAIEAAPVELLAARNKLGKAEVAVREERYDPARWLATEAEADAEVAERKARAVKAQAAAAELARSSDMLRQELNREGRP